MRSDPRPDGQAARRHPDFEAEQAYIDHAYEALDGMRREAERLRGFALAQPAAGGTHQARYERDVALETALRRLHRLDIGRESLVFGRLDLDSGEHFYVGRIGVVDADRHTLVVDWRAPVASAFYRATAIEPLGLVRRRHFVTEGNRLIALADEHFGPDAIPDDPETAQSALAAALDRPRTGHMRDIVATVQREQDEIIRAALEGVLAVQGGPGTGKTAVALHRAAYLLFTHRRKLERQGVMVVGPNQLFLRYIEQVLPALGESGVALTTLAGLVDELRVGAEDPPEVARVKGNARMRKVIARALADRQRPLFRDAVVRYEEFDLPFTVADSAEVVQAVRRRPGTHNARRRFVERGLVRRLWHRYLDRLTPSQREHADAERGREFAKALREIDEIGLTLDRMWPRLTPGDLLHDLFGSRPLLELACRGILSPAERDLLYRPGGQRLADVAWTPSDLALADEARLGLGPLRAADREPVRDYGHVVVDEVQDLTPMQLRMLSRRSLTGSMTVVGDLAQATGPLPPVSWEALLSLLPSERGRRVVPLSVNYRTPAEIMDFAARALRAVAPELPPPTAARATGAAPEIVAAGDVATTAADAAGGLAARVAPGTVAVIVPRSMLEALRDGLRAAGVAFGDGESEGLDQPVTLVAAHLAKGLEFDGVVAVEPARLARETPGGLRALYVTLTRATQRLVVVHGEPLPSALDAPV